MKGWPSGQRCNTYHSVLKQPRRQQLNHAYLGPEFSEAQITADLKKQGREISEAGARTTTPRRFQRDCSGQFVGWFEGG